MSTFLFAGALLFQCATWFFWFGSNDMVTRPDRYTKPGKSATVCMFLGGIFNIISMSFVVGAFKWL